MKKFLTVFAVLTVVCVSVFALEVKSGNVDLSVGGFAATKKVVAGGFVSVDYEPFRYKSLDLGFKADFLFGTLQKGVADDSKIHCLGSLKFALSHDFDDFTILGALGFGLNGFSRASSFAITAEADLSYNFAENFAAGFSVDMAYGLSNFSEVERWVPAGKLFATYKFGSV